MTIFHADPAEKLLTLTPDHTFHIAADGFTGAYYVPKKNFYPGKVVILAGGSDGQFGLTKLVAEQFAERGIAALALALWNEPGLPVAVSRIPLEYAAYAARWLQKEGYQKIGIWGISIGAPYALLCAAKFPDLIHCVIAASPSAVCTQGMLIKMGTAQEPKLLDCSAFSYQGMDIPYAGIELDKMKILADSLLSRSYSMRTYYDRVLASAPEDSEIPVEKINGPVLLLAADRDTVWNSKESADRIVARLKNHHFSFPVTYYHYEYASHYLLPCSIMSRMIFAEERKHPHKCRQSNDEAFEATLEFLQIW